MKEKKANWFTRNSYWLFIVLLLIDIILINYVISTAKLFIKYGVTWEDNWVILVYFILSILGVLITFIMAFFLIYLEDHLNDRNKRKIQIFEAFIKNTILKGGKE